MLIQYISTKKRSNMKKYFTQVIDHAFGLSEKKLSNPVPHQELSEKFDLKLNEDSFDDDVEKLIEDIFSNSVNTQNPRFLNQLFGGSTKEAWLGELLTAVLNTSMATYEIAPLATLMEKEILDNINKEIGFKNFSGILTPGGSYANMLGLHCARFFHDSTLKDKGLFGSPELKVFVSQDAHYSSEKALGLMGLGIESLILVDTDENKKMCVEDLKNKIANAKKEGQVPVCVVSTAGTTVWGAYDPISEINTLCKSEKIWHHVDAAWGGLVLWSKKRQELFKGIEDVDSITLDFHKLMASTLTKGIFLTAHADVLRGANSGGGSKYIFHDSEAIDMGVYSLQCGRKVDSLPIWLQWKLNGTVKFRNKIDSFYDLADWLVAHLESNNKDYKLLQNPEFMNICFQVIPKDTNTDIGAYNFKLREILMKRGNFMVNISSTDDDGFFFRLVFNHWDLTQEILLELLDELMEIKANA